MACHKAELMLTKLFDVDHITYENFTFLMTNRQHVVFGLTARVHKQLDFIAWHIIVKL